MADECRNQLLEGIQQVADAVRVRRCSCLPEAFFDSRYSSLAPWLLRWWVFACTPCKGLAAIGMQVTLGPRGRNVLLEKDYGPPLIVNDGVTIARNIELPNRAHNAGAKLVQEVASTSDEWAGDGTSSTTILTAEIAKKVLFVAPWVPGLN